MYAAASPMSSPAQQQPEAGVSHQQPQQQQFYAAAPPPAQPTAYNQQPQQQQLHNGQPREWSTGACSFPLRLRNFRKAKADEDCRQACARAETTLASSASRAGAPASAIPRCGRTTSARSLPHSCRRTEQWNPVPVAQYKTRLESLQLSGTAIPPGEARESASLTLRKRLSTCPEELTHFARHACTHQRRAVPRACSTSPCTA